MKLQLQNLVLHALTTLSSQPDFANVNLLQVPIRIERVRDNQFGDFATSIALQLAKSLGVKPTVLAEKIIAYLPASPILAKAEVAGPGFINFFISDKAFNDKVVEVIQQGSSYGLSQVGAGQLVHLEIISSNPTGPLHVGHGRLAAYGASLGNLLTAVGYKVHREYYVNDAGRQIDILAVSVWLRYLEHLKLTLPFPSNGYQGDYIVDIAKQLHEEYGDRFLTDPSQILKDLPVDEPEGGDKEIYIDAVIERAKTLLGTNYSLIAKKALTAILSDIREDLLAFGVAFEEWFSESDLIASKAVTEVIEILKKAGHVYEQDKALWFNAIHFGDEKDRVLVRSNGQTTYFASDVAYHFNKFQRGYHHIIDVFGADHHGYVSRIKAAIAALGKDVQRCSVVLVQFANLYRGSVRVPMSTRKGSFVTLRQLREEVGNDAARFFYIQRRADQHMDFDLELAKEQSSENPVYYIQYAHARVCSVLRQAEEKNILWDKNQGLKELRRLSEAHEKQLLRYLESYPETLENAANAREPHQLSLYLRELANALHTYYNAHQFLVEDVALRNARLSLIIAVRQVLANGLKIIGVSAPEKM